jgi:hypothetical protein
MEANIGGMQWDIPAGVMVVTADDVELGRVVDARPGLLVVEKGRLFPTDLYVPRAAIAVFDGEEVRLTVSKDQVFVHRWDREPDTEPFGDAYVADDFVPGAAAGGGTPDDVETPGKGT